MRTLRNIALAAALILTVLAVSSCGFLEDLFKADVTIQNSRTYRFQVRYADWDSFYGPSSDYESTDWIPAGTSYNEPFFPVNRDLKVWTYFQWDTGEYDTAMIGNGSTPALYNFESGTSYTMNFWTDSNNDDYVTLTY